MSFICCDDDDDDDEFENVRCERNNLTETSTTKQKGKGEREGTSHSTATKKSFFFNIWTCTNILLLCLSKNKQ